MRKQPLLFVFCITLLTAPWVHPLRAQAPTSDSLDLYDLSLEQLMNVSVVSASKKSENLFDAPLSASVVTREEIRKAGCTSLGEALRLMPGVIVREQTNGNYDIHLRGLDNVPPNGFFFNSYNSTTLVMIDNRPVYNYLQGGTFWQTLPIGLNDVERIEIVRGPSSALYGPNAASGVVHIITRKLEKTGWHAVANVQYGSHRTAIGNASIGYQVSPKLGVIVSGNYQGRNRQQYTYYDVKADAQVPVEALGARAASFYPDPMRALLTYGMNTFVHYAPGEKAKFSLAAGWQDAKSQYIFSENLISPLNTVLTNSRYLDWRATVRGFSAQVAYAKGTQGAAGLRGQKYDFQTTDAVLEYNLTLGKLSLKPGLNYRRALYEDSRYWDASKQEGVLNGSHEITTQAASLRAEYPLLRDKLRLVGGLRVDKFNYPSGYHASYQLAANYKWHEKHMFRAVFAQANRAPFILDTFTSLNLPRSIGPQTLLITSLQGNRNLELLVSRMEEIGYRGKLADNFQIDVDLFRVTTHNYANFINQALTTTVRDEVLVVTVPIVVQNLPLTVRQLGITVSANYVSNHFQAKPFITYQHTRLYNYSPFNNTADGPPTASNLNNPAQNNLNSGVGAAMSHQGTPRWYGGAFINYQFGEKWNVNINPYFYSAHTFYHNDNNTYRDGIRGIDHLRAKMLVNAKVAYQLKPWASTFVNARNLFNDQSREYYHADDAGGLYLVGATVDF